MIKKASSAKVREILQKPFGFKGASVDSLTVSHVKLETPDHTVYGSGIQSVLWSDGQVFELFGLSRGDELMHDITRHALSLLKGTKTFYPPHVMKDIYSRCLRYGVERSGLPNLRKTFVLNALVPVDNALWILYARENGIASYDGMLEEYEEDLSRRNNILAAVPLITYGTESGEIDRLLEEGYYFLKIKIGNGLEWDMERVRSIHEKTLHHETPYTRSQKPCLYLDANGTYRNPNDFRRLVDQMDREGILPSVAMVEEPFPEELELDVREFPVVVAGDESCHSAMETLERIDMGYRAIALKPIAKTLTFTLDVLREAEKRSIPCFCADLTVTPLLVEWNKSFAARIRPFPGTEGGVLESNGASNYTNWEELLSRLPMKDRDWVRPKKGVYRLSPEFFTSSAGILEYFEGEDLAYMEV
ncbi:MAG: hypothetical protein R6W96_03665 [Clostridia bacterium]